MAFGNPYSDENNRILSQYDELQIENERSNNSARADANYSALCEVKNKLLKYLDSHAAYDIILDADDDLFEELKSSRINFRRLFRAKIKVDGREIESIRSYATRSSTLNSHLDSDNGGITGFSISSNSDGGYSVSAERSSTDYYTRYSISNSTGRLTTCVSCKVKAVKPGTAEKVIALENKLSFADIADYEDLAADYGSGTGLDIAIHWKNRYKANCKQRWLYFFTTVFLLLFQMATLVWGISLAEGTNFLGDAALYLEIISIASIIPIVAFYATFKKSVKVYELEKGPRSLKIAFIFFCINYGIALVGHIAIWAVNSGLISMENAEVSIAEIAGVLSAQFTAIFGLFFWFVFLRGFFRLFKNRDDRYQIKREEERIRELMGFRYSPRFDEVGKLIEQISSYTVKEVSQSAKRSTIFQN